jgi:hypothetical protein
MKLTTTINMLCALFNIQKSNVQMANKQLANISWTYIAIFFSPSLVENFQQKLSLMGRLLMDTTYMTSFEIK